jgi:hypothetical protein
VSESSEVFADDKIGTGLSQGARQGAAEARACARDERDAPCEWFHRVHHDQLLASGHATQRSAAFAGLTVRRVADLCQGFVDGLVVFADLVDLMACLPVATSARRRTWPGSFRPQIRSLRDMHANIWMQ